MRMNAAFRFLEWYNNNYAAEHLILSVLGLFCGIGLISYIFVDPQMLNFSIFIGGGLAVNMYAVTIIQRKYIAKTQERLEDIDYLPPEDDFVETKDGSLSELEDLEDTNTNSTKNK